MNNLHARRLVPALSVAFLAAAAFHFFAPPLCAAPAAPAAKAASGPQKPPVAPIDAAFSNAEQLFRTGKYAESIKAYNDLLVKFDKEIKAKKEQGDNASALVHLRIAAAWQALPVEKEEQKELKWKEVEKELTLFLKYPNGIGDLLGDNDNRVSAAQIALAHAYGQLQKWDEALRYLEPLRKSTLSKSTEVERIRFTIAYCKALIGKAESKNATAAKNTIQECLANYINPFIARRDFQRPEIREAGDYAIELLNKLGHSKEARALSDTIEDSTKGNPLDRVKASFQRLEIGDGFFRQAEEIILDDKNSNPEEKAKRERLYRQALATFQETLRFAPLSALLEEALKTQEEKTEQIKKRNSPPAGSSTELTDDQKSAIALAEQERDGFVKAVEKFRKTTDYDGVISYRIALCLLELQRPWESIIAFRDIFDNSPKFSKMSTAHYYYIRALRTTNRIKEAQEECRNFIKKYPAAPDGEVGDIAVTIGEISFELGDYKEAIAQFKWARENVKSLTVSYKEWIDWYIAVANFQFVEWEAAEVAIRDFLGKYPKSQQLEQMVYMRALCYFYLTKYQETMAAFGEYLKQYPNGRFLPEAEYRLALIEFGLKPDVFEREIFDFKKRNGGRKPAAWEMSNNIKVEKQAKAWLDKYDPKKLTNKPADYVAGIQKQIPEMYTLIGDVYFRYLDDKSPINTDVEKKKHLRLAIDNYIKAALTSDENSQTFDFVLRELDRRLPAQNEWGRLLEIYNSFYVRNPDGPKADGYLYQILKAVERLGKTPEARRAKLAAEGIKGIPDEYLTKPAVEILATAVKRSIANYKQDKVELLIGELANRIVAKTRREVQQEARAAREAAAAALAPAPAPAAVAPTAPQGGATPPAGTVATTPAAAAPAPEPEVSREERDRRRVEESKKILNRATTQIATLLKPEGEVGNIVSARIYYARAQVAQLLRNTEAYDENIARIVAAFKEEELSPALLAAGADYLLEKKNYTRADSYAQYILDHWRSSEYADVGLLTKAEVLLVASEVAAKTNAAEAHAKALEALAFLREATEEGILFNKEKEIRLAHARTLMIVGGKAPDGKLNYDIAIKILKEAQANKQWRGEYTAWCLYYLGQIEEKKHNDNEAINYYRSCFLSRKKHGNVTAKAYIRVIELFRKKNDRDGVGGTIYDMLQENNPASKQPEAAFARQLQSQYPWRPPVQPAAAPTAPAPQPAPK